MLGTRSESRGKVCKVTFLPRRRIVAQVREVAEERREAVGTD